MLRAAAAVCLYGDICWWAVVYPGACFWHAGLVRQRSIAGYQICDDGLTSWSRALSATARELSGPVCFHPLLLPADDPSHP